MKGVVMGIFIQRYETERIVHSLHKNIGKLIIIYQTRSIASWFAGKPWFHNHFVVRMVGVASFPLYEEKSHLEHFEINASYYNFLLAILRIVNWAAPSNSWNSGRLRTSWGLIVRTLVSFGLLKIWRFYLLFPSLFLLFLYWWFLRKSVSWY